MPVRTLGSRCVLDLPRAGHHEEVRVGHTPEPLSGKPSKVGTTGTLHKQDSTAHEKRSVHRIATPASSSTRVVLTPFFQSGASQPEKTDKSGRKSPLPAIELKTKPRAHTENISSSTITVRTPLMKKDLPAKQMEGFRRWSRFG